MHADKFVSGETKNLSKNGVLRLLVRKIFISLHGTQDPYGHNARLAYGNNICLTGAILYTMP
jgi:hypothetical protein